MGQANFAEYKCSRPVSISTAIARPSPCRSAVSYDSARRCLNSSRTRNRSTTTSTVDRIERSSRLLTLRSKDNVFQTVHVDTDITAFDDLRVGDVVTVRYTESVIVALRSNATLSPTQDTTAEARKEDEQVVEQLKPILAFGPADAIFHCRTGSHAEVLETLERLAAEVWPALRR